MYVHPANPDPMPSLPPARAPDGILLLFRPSSESPSQAKHPQEHAYTPRASALRANSRPRSLRNTRGRPHMVPRYRSWTATMYVEFRNHGRIFDVSTSDSDASDARAYLARS
ncbi:hypothetical protein C8Q77DRAFT_607813 [Trametes polyzona]|nr:hypothetical protein C8Q77DRAFT_607813 [Trametes polyzona]